MHKKYYNLIHYLYTLITVLQVEAIARARVPIVKFQDRSSRLMVDLSFRNAMAVYNTQLINQYTRTHPLVRPYLMVIRYWAKIQVGVLVIINLLFIRLVTKLKRLKGFLE